MRQLRVVLITPGGEQTMVEDAFLLPIRWQGILLEAMASPGRRHQPIHNLALQCYLAGIGSIKGNVTVKV
jgi:hypothetical protein